MLLSKTCVNAIKATLEIASQTVGQDRQYIPVKDVAEQVQISYHFLGKIAQILIEAGILNSLRGPNGGVGLARSADKIHLIDIVNATDGSDVFEKCILGLPECSEDQPCQLHQAWEKSRDGLLQELNTETLASINQKRNGA